MSRIRLSYFTFTFHFHALEKEMATHSSVLAWRIPGTGEPGGLLSLGSHRVRHDWSDLAAAAAAVLDKPGLPRWLRGKESVSQRRSHRRFSFNPWVGKIPWRKKWQCTPVFVSEKSHGQRSLAVHGVTKELNMTEHTHIRRTKNKPKKNEIDEFPTAFR